MTSSDGTPLAVSSMPAEASLEAYVVGVNTEPGTTSFNTLNSLDLLNRLTLASKSSATMDPIYANIFNQEKKYIQKSAELLANNQQLQMKFGNTMQSVFALLPLVKQKYAQFAFDDLIKDQIYTATDATTIKSKRSAFTSRGST